MTPIAQEPSADARNRSKPRVYIAVWAALATVSVLPFALTPVPPLNDYPSHLARAYLIEAVAQSDQLQSFYRIQWDLIPNLAVDAIVPVLSRIVPVETAMIAFTILGMLLLSSGVLAISHALFGRLSPAPFASFLILYKRQLLWGFVGYLFTLGVSFWVFAWWVRSADRRFETARLILFTIASSALFLGHLHAFATYAILIAGYELTAAAKRERAGRVAGLLLASLQFVPAIGMFLVFSPTRNRATEIEYGSLLSKATGIVDAFHAYHTGLDAFTAVALGLLVIYGLATRSLSIHRSMLLSIVVLTVLFFLLPATMLGSFAADRRLATSIYFIAAGSMFWRFSGSRAAIVAVAFLSALFVVRMAVVALHWRDAGRVYSRLLTTLESIPAGRRIAAAVAKPSSPFLEDPPVMFFASMAVVRRNAFVNTLFADEGHQPLHLVYRPADVQQRRLPHIFYVNQRGPESSWSAPDPFTRIRVDDYDYFLLFNTRYFTHALPQNLEPVIVEPGVFGLYRKGVTNPVEAMPSDGSAATSSAR